MALTAEEAIKRAEKVIEKAGADYDSRLAQLFADLNKAVGEDDRKGGIVIAHRIKGEAGMFGWPLVSVVAGWLRQLLEAGKGPCATEVVRLHLETLRMLVANDLRGEAPAGQKVIRELYAVVEKQGLIPAS